MIKTEALTRTYETVKAVDNVSFEIAHGQIVGLLGHNGAGKTTIMKMITGFIEPSSGSIEIDGLKIDSDREQIQKKIGYLPENCPLYPEMNVIDFLDYAANLKGLSETKKTDAIRTAIHKTNLGTVAEKQVNTLSRGYRQRLGVAQAILNEPKILILDEPTNGLDPSQIQEMRNLIKDLARNATLVISTHILQEVQATCDRVILIKKGVVAVDASMT
ncbi:MAG: ABC transporter ATP-binding protein, partial [Candidatus Obscuribacterales bacterium]|nr:ABC transporter ATP-binding protein [Candidatus Obscuribacterales bacterium]